MEIRPIMNPPRGCGTLKQGGCYARGDMSPGGRLTAWTWELGEGLIGGRNLTMTVPPRGMQLIRLPDTLAEHRMMTDDTPLALPGPLTRLPKFALIDHVGADNYSAYSFAEEVRTFGPSRRIPEAFARTLALHLPLPILFTHSHVPLIERDYMDRMMEFISEVPASEFWYGISHDHDEWGLYRGNYNGGDHWMLPFLKRLAENQPKHLTTILPHELAEQTLLEEQTIGLSWITRCVYITNGDEPETKLEDLLAAGIEPVSALSNSTD